MHPRLFSSLYWKFEINVFFLFNGNHYFSMFDCCKTRFSILQKNTTLKWSCVFQEAPTRFELVMKVLQTSALPLGYGALFLYVTLRIPI